MGEPGLSAGVSRPVHTGLGVSCKPASNTFTDPFKQQLGGIGVTTLITQLFLVGRIYILYVASSARRDVNSALTTTSSVKSKLLVGCLSFLCVATVRTDPAPPTMALTFFLKKLASAITDAVGLADVQLQLENFQKTTNPYPL